MKTDITLNRLWRSDRLRRWLLFLWMLPLVAWGVFTVTMGSFGFVYAGALLAPLTPAIEWDNESSGNFLFHLFAIPGMALFGMIVGWFSGIRRKYGHLLMIFYFAGSLWVGALITLLGFESGLFNIYGIFSKLWDWPFWVSWSLATFIPPALAFAGFKLFKDLVEPGNSLLTVTAEFPISLPREEIWRRLGRSEVTFQANSEKIERIFLVSGEPMTGKALYGCELSAIQFGEGIPFYLRILSNKTPDRFTYRRFALRDGVLEAEVTVTGSRFIVEKTFTSKEMVFLPEDWRGAGSSLRREAEFWRTWLEGL